MSNRVLPHGVLCIFCGFLLLLSPGCALVGVIAAKAVPPPTILARYKGLAGKSVGIMVWTERGIQIDRPTLPLDTANSLQNKLSAVAGKKQALEGATFPVAPKSIVRYQLDHPEAETVPVTITAPKLGVERLIYIEITDLTTRSELAGELFRGTMATNIKVIEIENGIGKVAYEESGLASVYPPKSPPEGLPRGDDFKMYVGAIDEMTTEIARRFISYQEDE